MPTVDTIDGTAAADTITFTATDTIEVVARFRPVCSLVKVDQGSISGC